MITPNKKKILKYMVDNDIVTFTDFCLQLKISKPTLRKVLNGEEIAEKTFLKLSSYIPELLK